MTGVRGNRSPRAQLREKNQRIRSLRQRLLEKDRQIEGILSGRHPAMGPGGETDVPIFFLVGQARSGTSWLMRSLDAHPEILCRGEGRIVGRSYMREDVKRMESATMQPSSLQRAMLESEYLRAWIERSVWTRDGDADRYLTNLTRIAATHFLLDRLSRSGKAMVGDKTPFLSDETIAELAELFPESRVIHIIRDGRDVAVSWMHHLWNRDVTIAVPDLRPDEKQKRRAYREDPRKVIEAGEGIFTEQRLRELAGTWSSRVARATADGRALYGDRYTEVRYEGLLEHPEDELRRLLDFLGADSDAEVVRGCLVATSFEHWTKGRTRGEEDSRSPLRKGIVGDWRNVFTRRDKRIFDELAGDLLIELGYERDHDWCREER